MGAERLKLPMLWALRVFIGTQIDRQDGSVGRSAWCIRPEFEHQNFIVEWQSHLSPTTAAVTTVNSKDGTISSSVCNLQLADEVCITYLPRPFGHSWDVLSSLIALLFVCSTLFNIWLLKYVFVFMHVNVCSHACVRMTNDHWDWERSSPLELDLLNSGNWAWVPCKSTKCFSLRDHFFSLLLHLWMCANRPH